MIISALKLEEADMKNRVYLSLGSNMGDRQAHLRAAVESLASNEAIQIINKSGFYTTSPVGYLDQDDFINAVIEIEANLSPLEILALCQTIEAEQQRERLIRWGPRTLDLDVLWIENFTQTTDELTVPHPRMTERAFVMVPLSEMAPSLMINGKSVLEYCKELASQEVRKMDHEKW